MLELLITLGLRIVWQAFPSLFTCLLFWITILLLQLGVRPSFPWLLVTIGVFMNMVVTVANGGFMPVVNSEAITNSLWVTSTDATHLLRLADRFSLGHVAVFSLGDIFLEVGILLSLFI